LTVTTRQKRGRHFPKEKKKSPRGMGTTLFHEKEGKGKTGKGWKGGKVHPIARKNIKTEFSKQKRKDRSAEGRRDVQDRSGKGRAAAPRKI